MLQPQNYPAFLTRALLLDDAPLEVMAADDNPWLEGLTIVSLIGVTVGFARWIGGTLTVLSLPDPNAMLAILLQGLSQLGTVSSADLVTAEALLRSLWQNIIFFTGWNDANLRLLNLVATPVSLLVWWLFFAGVTHLLAKTQQGHANFNQHLGATSLMTAPHLLFALGVIPFVNVSWPLVVVWSLLIGYRAVKASHDIPWQRAAVIALVPALLVGAGMLVMLLISLTSLLAGGPQSRPTPT